MQHTLCLIGLIAVTACSLEHVVIAELDEAVAGSSPMAEAGRPTFTVGGAAGAAPSAAFGGTVASGGSPSSGDAGWVSISSGGVDNTVIGTFTDGGGASEVRCSCLGGEQQACGTDGITYPTDCGDAGPCVPPAIACLHACPCFDTDASSGGAPSLSWFSIDCVSTARCSEGVICMSVTNATPDNTQRTCAN